MFGQLRKVQLLSNYADFNASMNCTNVVQYSAITYRPVYQRVSELIPRQDLQRGCCCYVMIYDASDKKAKHRAAAAAAACLHSLQLMIF